jgi:hypothetical protein
MMYLVLLKVPFSLLRAGLYWKVSTSPNPPPREGEGVGPQGMERVTHQMLKRAPIVCKVRSYFGHCMNTQVLTYSS